MIRALCMGRQILELQLHFFKKTLWRENNHERARSPPGGFLSVLGAVEAQHAEQRSVSIFIGPAYLRTRLVQELATRVLLAVLES